MSQQFSRENRITQRNEFELVYRTGRRLENSHFRLYVIERHESTPRLGLTIPKRVGNSVVRNRLKRLIREWFRIRKERLHALDLVIQPNALAPKLEYEELCKSLDSLIKENLSSIHKDVEGH